MDLDYLDEFRGCAVDPIRTQMIEPDHFYGITINKDFESDGTTETNRVMYPIMFTREDELFFGIGYDFYLRGYLFPGFMENNEQHMALKVRLSVFDQRDEPKISAWGEWSGTPPVPPPPEPTTGDQTRGWTEPCTVCGENQPKVSKITFLFLYCSSKWLLSMFVLQIYS